jgi:hypothetical protein
MHPTTTFDITDRFKLVVLDAPFGFEHLGDHLLDCSMVFQAACTGGSSSSRRA